MRKLGSPLHQQQHCQLGQGEGYDRDRCLHWVEPHHRRNKLKQVELHPHGDQGVQGAHQQPNYQI